MTDDDLKRLKDLPVPPARAEAKATALAAAMAAFDAGDATSEAAAKKNDDASQGCAEPVRLTHASQTRRRSLMRVSSHYKIAASISVLLIAAPLTYHMLSQHQEEANRPVASAKTDSALPAPPAPSTREMAQAEQTPRIYVERINIVGNSRARDYVIRRELRLAEGDIYEKNIADQALKRLEQLGFFKSVKLSQETGSKSDRIVLTYTLEEIPSGEMSIAGAYTPECCADIEKRVADLEALQANNAGQGLTLQVYGQVNKALLVWDDGIDSDAFVVDNQLASSRVGLKGKAQRSAGASAGYSAEFEVGGSSNQVAQNDADGVSKTPIRQNNFYVESDKLGRITVGPTESASNEWATNLGASRSQPMAAPKKAIQERLSNDDASQTEVASNLEERINNALDGSPQESNKSSPVQTTPVPERQQMAAAQPPSATTRSRAPEGTLLRESPPVAIEKEARDKFEAVAINPVKQVAAEPVSTFSTDVDTASYAFVRRALNDGRLPPKDAVRVEEMINYFPYTYPLPEKADAPFQPTVTVTPAPWNTAHKLMHIGIKGYDIKTDVRPRANLVFLIDVSGSMDEPDKLPLVKKAFRLLVDELKPDDTIGIVTYASGSGVVLEPTKIADKQKILTAIERLGAGGSTAGARGIQDAYHLAETNFDKAAVNRIILATDGDFNVGITNQDELKGFIERKRQTGIFLSILGVGQGNYNDSLMQKLAQNGNGTAAYVDTLNEARKVLVDEASSTLFPIAKDVKIQVEFNPTQVSEYRLIGYETRALKREDFNNDKVDAGDIGSGHTVTAIYEITPVGAPKSVDELRYQKSEEHPAAAPVNGTNTNEYAFLKLRYKLPKEDTSKLITLPVTKEMEKPSIDAAPEDVRFSVAVAAFGQFLKGQPYVQSYSLDDVMALAKGARGSDDFGYRAEFVNLVRLAKSIRP